MAHLTCLDFSCSQFRLKRGDISVRPTADSIPDHIRPTVSNGLRDVRGALLVPDPQPWSDGDAVFFIRNEVKLLDKQLQDLNFNVMVEVKRSIENLLASMREGLERSIHTIGSAWLPAAVIGGNGDSRGLRRIRQPPSIQSEASCWPRYDPIRLSDCGAGACPPHTPFKLVGDGPSWMVGRVMGN